MTRRLEHDRLLRDLTLWAPPAMVTAVARRRLAGDWRGVCVAGRVVADVDLTAVRRRYGAAAAHALAADLGGFVPDLLRLVAPRDPHGMLLSGIQIVLSRHAGPIGAGVPVLVAGLPPMFRHRQDLMLRVADAGDLPPRFFDLPDWCWHADAVAGRRRAYQAGRAWRPVTPQEGPAVWAAAGFTVRSEGPRWFREFLAGYAQRLPLYADDLRRLADRHGRTVLHTTGIAVDLAAPGGPLVRHAPITELGAGPSAFTPPLPRDAALLTPDELHPLVHDALFPGRTQLRRTLRLGRPRTVWVRDGGEAHPVRATGGVIRTPHPPGADCASCEAAVAAWRTGGRAARRVIRSLRRDLFDAYRHGDTDTVLAMCADGVDPSLRTSWGESPMHLLPLVDHTRVLPVLRAAGLSLDAADRHGRTPATVAAYAGDTGLVAALVAAGADPPAVDQR